MTYLPPTRPHFYRWKGMWACKFGVFTAYGNTPKQAWDLLYREIQGAIANV